MFFPTLFEANFNIDEWFKVSKVDIYVKKSRCLKTGVEVM